MKAACSKLPEMEAGVPESTIERVTLYRMETTFLNSSRITSASSDLRKIQAAATESSKVEVTF